MCQKLLGLAWQPSPHHFQKVLDLDEPPDISNFIFFASLDFFYLFSYSIFFLSFSKEKIN
jgi:hypothetical protein